MPLRTENILIANPRIRNLLVLTALIITFFASWLPDFEMGFVVEEGRISSILAFGTLNGFLLGPFIGPIVSLIAMLSHIFINPDYLGDNLFTMLSPTFVTLASVVAGLCITGRQKIAAIIYGVLILAWFATPEGIQAYQYLWFHLVVFACFIAVIKTSAYKRITKQWQVFIYLFLSGLLAVLADHLAGSITAAFVFNLEAELFQEFIFIYPVERTVLALGGAASAYIFFQWANVLQNEKLDKDESIVDLKEVIDYIETDVKAILQKEKK
ncbi:hypothetical protein J2755_001033 [Methanohalophilus levihalophilus]|uniref:hypothetical protein n=1 Tax=Methanohalophilus levihalophilus TaxID=1431282 RepID=UPI001AEA402A|nr:hypothetical protein [Methanohalophilus levihalophilus]MBP2030099.1 hypothetical protein [Methanohalophilus levihalophilus]